MSTDLKQGESRPMEPLTDEGYWESLLNEGEFAHAVLPIDLDNSSPDKEHSHEFSYRSDQPTRDISEAAISSDWQEIERIMLGDQALELKVVGHNRGGLLVEWQSLRGFVPASQLVSFPMGKQNHQRVNMTDRIGQTLRLRVIELDQEKNRLILSERAAQVAAGVRAGILNSLQAGDTTTGTITNLCDFGAFVDLGGVEGLIHISELSWGRVGHPADMLQRGQTVTAYVLDVHVDDARIALSLKRLHPDPWMTVDTQYQIGELVTGRITNVVDFGAFACIAEGLEGLIHFSELAEGHFLHPRNVVSEGDIVKARILSIDGRARRLGLSLRTE